MSFELGQETHTFTILGRCPRTRQLGVCISTGSLAVGGYCPFVKANTAALATQSFANPQLGPLAMRLLESGFSTEKVMKELEDHDPYFHYRQIGIVDRNGSVAVRTGQNSRDWKGHVVGDGFVAMGNFLAGEQVVQAMARTFQEYVEEELEERLLSSVEAGRDAGGQMRGVEGMPQGQRSSTLIVYEYEEYPLVDLRVDDHDEPEAELRRVYTAYKPLISLYYHTRAKDPAQVPPQDEWVRRYHEQHGSSTAAERRSRGGKSLGKL